MRDGRERSLENSLKVNLNTRQSSPGKNRGFYRDLNFAGEQGDHYDAISIEVHESTPAVTNPNIS